MCLSIGQQIRKLFGDDIEKLKNTVEFDETYCDGKESINTLIKERQTLKIDQLKRKYQY